MSVSEMESLTIQPLKGTASVRRNHRNQFAVRRGAAFASGMIQGFTGFGGGLMVEPFLAVLFSPIEAISIAAIAAMLDKVMIWPNAIKKVHWPEVAPVSISVAIAIPLGLMFLISADPALIQRGMGVFILGAAAVLMTGWTFGVKRSVLTSAVTGALTGGITGGFGIPGGQFMVIYLLSAPVAPPNQRANIIVAASVGMVIMIIGLIFGSAYDQATIMRTIIIAPLFLAGTWACRTLFKIAPIAWFKNVTYTILIATGIMSLII